MNRVDSDSAMKALKDSTRRRLIRLLAEEGPLEYSEILRRLNLKYTGRLNYHLKVLREYVEKDEKNRYYLNEKGRQLYELMLNFKTWPHARFAIRNLAILAFLLMTFSFALIFYSGTSYYYGRLMIVGEGLLVIGKSLFVTSLILLLIIILVHASPNPEPPRPALAGLLEVNVYPTILILLIVLVGIVFTSISQATVELADLLLWSLILLPPALSWKLTVEKYGLSLESVLLSSAVLFSVGITIIFSATVMMYGLQSTLRGAGLMVTFLLVYFLVEVLMGGIKQITWRHGG